MIQHKICASCKSCCRFAHDHIRNEYSEEELLRHYCFSRHLSQTIFQFDKKRNKFIMAKYCKHYDNFCCDIYNTEHFPFICAAYPFFVITEKSLLNDENTCHLAIDKNCPHWKLFLKQADCINEILKKYLDRNLPIDTFPLKKMQSLGYRLTLLNTELLSIS